MTNTRMTPETTRTALPFLGLACALSVSSIYYHQPLLLEMGHTFGSLPGLAGFVAVATQAGFVIGLLVFVPLGDVLERRALLMKLFAAVSVSLLLVATAPNLVCLICASALTGLFASVTQVVVPIAPDVVEERQRGRAIGVVMTCLLLGITSSRLFAGWFTKVGGWRGVFVVAAAANALLVLLASTILPKLPPKLTLGYGAAMRSVWTLWRTEPVLRQSAILSNITLAASTCFWTVLAFLLSDRYGLGPAAVGSFALTAVAKALVIPLAVRLGNKRGSRYVVTSALSIMTLAFLLLWGEEQFVLTTTIHLSLLALGLVSSDIGVEMTHVANQSQVLGLIPEARSRLNTAYVTIYFGGRAFGSAFATLAWIRWGWDGISAFALCFIALAVVCHAIDKSVIDPRGLTN